MTHEEAVAIIEPTGLTLAARTDLAAVQAILEPNPGLIEAMNALNPKPGEETPQRAAARSRKIDILQYFVDKGVQPDLFMSCALGNTQLVDAYLTLHPKDVNAVGAHGIALMVHANSPDMVKVLLKHGANPTITLQQLSWSGRVELMQLAIDAGAKINEPPVGRRPIHIASAMGRLEAVQLLLKLGADPHARSKGADWERKNCLALAIMGNHTEVAEYLRNNSPPPPPVAPSPPRPRGPFGRGVSQGGPRRARPFR